MGSRLMYIEQRSRIMYGYIVSLCTSPPLFSRQLADCFAHVCISRGMPYTCRQAIPPAATRAKSPAIAASDALPPP